MDPRRHQEDGRHLGEPAAFGSIAAGLLLGPAPGGWNGNNVGGSRRSHTRLLNGLLDAGLRMFGVEVTV